MSGSTPVPRIARIPLSLNVNENVHISVLSDVHLESTNSDLDGLRKLMEERAKLPNHRFILLGDVLDLVVPTDTKRWRPGTQRDEVSAEAWINETLKFAKGFFKKEGYVYDLIIPGNHEDEIIKRHGVDMTDFLAESLGAQRGGYSGALVYKLNMTKTKGVSFRIAFHHGAWGGVSKGYPAAMRFFGQIEGWNVALYGHNHAASVNKEVRRRISYDNSQSFHFDEHNVYLVDCGSWVETYGSDARKTHYGERHGYVATPRTAPLIRFSMKEMSKDHKKRLWLDYDVSI